jgi:CHAT domain-containing protein/tetratricopeptide (TPR) repeat protein
VPDPMRKTNFSILLFLICLSAAAQVQQDQGLKKTHWRILASKFAKEKNAAAVVANLQSLVNTGKAKGKFGMVIYYELLLGEQFEKMDEFGLAESSFIQAYEDTKKHLPLKHHKYYLLKAQFHKTYFDPVDRLGYFYLTIGNLKQAEQLFQESIILRNQFFPKHSVHRIYPVVGMGSYYFRKGQYDKTYRQFSLAHAMLSRATTTGFDFDNVNRLFLNDLAELCLILNKEDEALRYINRLAVASAGPGKFSSDVAARLEVARIFELKSRFYLTFGNFKKSQEYLDKANHYNPASLTVSATHLKLLKTEALLHWYQNQVEQAAQVFQKLIDAYRLSIQTNFAAMSDYEREQFYYTLKNDFDLFNSFVIQNPALAVGHLYGEMYDNVLNTKALLLNETNKLKNQILQSGDQNLIKKLNQWEGAKDHLAALYFEKNSGEQIDSLQKSIEGLERQINQASSLFQQKESKVAWQGVQSKLKEGEAAIEIVRANRFNAQNPRLSPVHNGLTDSVVYVALMVTPEFKQPVCFLLNGTQLEKHFLPYYRNSIMAKTEDKLSYDNFWRPIKTHLNGIKRIFLSADGVYNQINLNTLQNPVSKNYLIDEIQLVVVTNTGDLLIPPSASKNKDAALVGRPTFEFTPSEISVALAPSGALPNGTRSLASEELISFKDQKFSDLPGTAEEVSIIASALKKQNMHVTSYLGQDALEENVKALRSPEILHIATHGFFVGDTTSSVSPMIRSGIILAGVRNPENKSRDDGILTAYEATNLDLAGTDLVALSACQTGLGEVRNGEGVYGLQRSIIVAGAKNLLMSLWKVDDEATAKLMESFYQLRAEKSNVEAFREAQIKLREIYPEPFYWGAFIMLGK